MGVLGHLNASNRLKRAYRWDQHTVFEASVVHHRKSAKANLKAVRRHARLLMNDAWFTTSMLKDLKHRVPHDWAYWAFLWCLAGPMIDIGLRGMIVGAIVKDSADALFHWLAHWMIRDEAYKPMFPLDTRSISKMHRHPQPL